VRFLERQPTDFRLRKRRIPAFLRCERDTDKEFPSGSACVVPAAQNFVPGKWTALNRRQKCPRPAEVYRRRDIAPLHGARERRSSEPSCTKCLRRVVTGSIVRKNPLRKSCGKPGANSRESSGRPVHRQESFTAPWLVFSSALDCKYDFARASSFK
jgi:hypothetical protein